MPNGAVNKNTILSREIADFYVNNTEKTHFAVTTDFTLLYFERASGDVFIETEKYTVKNNSVFILSPMCFYRFDFKNAPSGYFIEFSKEDLIFEVREHFSKLLDQNTNNLLSLYDLPAEFSLAIRRLYCTETKSYVYLRTLLSEILLLMDGVELLSQQSDEYTLNHRIFEYLNANFDIPFSLQRLADRFFKSKYYISHSFSCFFGIPPHKFVTLKRLAKAKMLINGGTPKNEAASLVGYTDYTVFFRAYKKLYRNFNSDNI